MIKIKNHVLKYKIYYEILLSLLVTIGVLQILNVVMTNKYLLFVLLYIGVFATVKFGVRRCNKRRLMFSLIFCIPFGILFCLGKNIVYNGIDMGGGSVIDVLSCIALTALFVLMGIGIFGFIDDKCGIFLTKSSSRNIKKIKWFLYAGILFLCWLPLFMIFFPGQVSVDSAVMISQILGETELSNWHPILYVCLIAVPIRIGFYMFGNLTLGIALAVMLQMVVLSIIFGYVSCWCANKTGKKIVGVLFICFFAFCPIVSCYSITLWKDVLFSAVFLLLIVKLYDFICRHRKGDKITVKDLSLIIVLVVLVAFLRNGGWLIVIALGLALFMWYNAARKTIGITFAVVIAVTIMIQTVGYKAIGIAKSPFMESMSVPAQQMAYVASIEGLTDEEREKLSSIANTESMASKYSSMNADPAKNSFNYDLVEENKIEFLANWWEMLKNHFPGYIKAYFLQMYSYWYIQGYSWSLSYEHNHDDLWLKEDYDDIPLLGYETKNFVEQFENSLMNTSWFGWIGSTGVVFWSMIFITLVYIYQRRYKLLILVICPLTYLVSLLIACPIAASFRYVYSIMLILPILAMVCFTKEKRRLE